MLGCISRHNEGEVAKSEVTKVPVDGSSLYMLVMSMAHHILPVPPANFSIQETGLSIFEEIIMIHLRLEGPTSKFIILYQKPVLY